MAKAKSKNLVEKRLHERLGWWALVVAAVLMIPFLTKAPWTAGDYIFAGVVLFGCATVYEFATKNVRDNTRKVLVGVAVVAVLFLVWGWAVA